MSNASGFERMCVLAKTLVAEGATRNKQEFNADKDLLIELVGKERTRAMQQCEKPYNTFLNEVKKVSLRSDAEANRTRVDEALEQLQGALAAQTKRYAAKADAAKEIRAGNYAPSESAAFIDDTSIDAADVLYISSSDDEVSRSESDVSESDLSSSSSSDDENECELELELGSDESSAAETGSSGDDDDYSEESEKEESLLGKRTRAKIRPRRRVR